MYTQATEPVHAMQSAEPQTMFSEQLQQAQAMQRQLEQLLKQGRTHLMELRRQAESAVAERDRLSEERDRVTLELSELRGAYEQLSDEHASQASALRAAHQQALEEQRIQIQQMQADHDREAQELRGLLDAAMSERDVLAGALRDRHAEYARYAEETSIQRAELEGRVTALVIEGQELERALSGSRSEVEQFQAEAERVRALARQIIGDSEAGDRGSY